MFPEAGLVAWTVRPGADSQPGTVLPLVKSGLPAGRMEGDTVQMSPKGCLYLLIAVVVVGVLIGLGAEGPTP